MADARQYTVPVASALSRAQRRPQLTTRQKYTRGASVVAEKVLTWRLSRRPSSRCRTFADYDTTVMFIPQESTAIAPASGMAAPCWGDRQRHTHGGARLLTPTRVHRQRAVAAPRRASSESWGCRLQDDVRYRLAISPPRAERTCAPRCCRAISTRCVEGLAAPAARPSSC
ncbi:MAG: hypothetical protein ACLSVD_09835 [Eggerthellaceae bacterium]